MQVDDAFTFASQPALNLHHLLWAEAWAVESAETGRPSRAQPVTGNLALQETPGFQAGIDYYRAHLIERHLLFDDTMHELSQRLVGRGGAAPAGWEEVFTPVLGDYLDADWPVHDQQNQAWAASSRAQLEELLPAALDRLQHLFRQALPDPPVLISTVYVGDRLPGFTSLHPTHITCSSSHPEIQGIAAGEIILHEASHALIPDLRRAIEVRIDASQQPLGQLWHVVLFFITGEVVARHYAERGVAYTPYLEATGLLDRAWPQFREPVTDAWTGYLDSRWDWDSACDRLADNVNQH